MKKYNDLVTTFAALWIGAAGVTAGGLSMTDYRKITVNELFAGVRPPSAPQFDTDPLVSTGWDILHALYHAPRPRPIAYLSRETGNTQHMLNRWTAALTSAGLVIAVATAGGVEYALASETRSKISRIDAVVADALEHSRRQPS